MNNAIDIEKFVLRPHLVIVGAGATVDSIPNGDRNGRKSSVMNGFIDNLGLREIIDGSGIQSGSENLEDIYSTLAEREDCKDVREQLEDSIFEYFSSLEIPDTITKYDLLVLSLTKKDYIASFNWDGLLIDAYQRMRKITDDLPELLFLHGNVKAGYCHFCGHFGYYRNSCPKCHFEYFPTQLLYPTRHKDYSKDLFIKTQWEKFEEILSKAAILTIYGYSAPKTDVEAIEKLTKAFTRYSDNRFFDYIQIIERPGFNYSEISNAWLELSGYVHGHLNIKESFFDTYLAEFPRRSVEGYAKVNLKGWWESSDVSFDKDKGVNYTFKELQKFISPILAADPFKSL